MSGWRNRFVDLSAVLVHGDTFDLREVLREVSDQRDGARALIVSMTAQNAAERAVASQTCRVLAAELAAAVREADRLRHGVPVEGDFVCPDALKLDVVTAELEALRREHALYVAEHAMNYEQGKATR